MDTATCETCQVPLPLRDEPSGRTRRFCSDACRHRAKVTRRAAVRVMRPCQVCGNRVSDNHERYCSDACRANGRRELQARYRRQAGVASREEYREGRAWQPRQCEACGAEYVARKETRTCSYECGMLLRDMELGSAPRTEFACIVPWDRLALRSRYTPPARCLRCSSTFIDPSGKRYLRLCSECKRRNKRAATVQSRHRSRARRYGVIYDPSVKLLEVAVRDRWACHLCGDPVLKGSHRSGAPHPLGPSIDHIVPMSLGGAHTWENVALAHHLCNALKGNRVQVSA